jgi:hypothetical protein
VFLFNTLLLHDPKTFTVFVKEKGLGCEMMRLLSTRAEEDEDLAHKVSAING